MPADQKADDAHRRDAAPLAELNDGQDAPKSILPCTLVRFVPLPKEERVGRLARALAVLLGGEEARDEQAAGH